MQDDKPHYLIESPDDYAAFWSARHVAELGNPHARFYNPLRKERRWVDLETVEIGLAVVVLLMVFSNLIAMVLG